MFIEHIPRAECLQDTVQLQSTTRRDISADAHRYIAYTVFVYGHIQSVGVTVYRIFNIFILYCEAEEVGRNVTNNRK